MIFGVFHLLNHFLPVSYSSMHEISYSSTTEIALFTLTILVSVCAGLLLILTIAVFIAISRLGSVQRLLMAQKGKSSRAEEPLAERNDVADAIAGGQFERFLNEDPARKLLTKKEQSTAFRKWRQQQGMNWTNS